jgi:hypothetical protein
VDDVKRLLTEFADRAVDGIPPADVDADVARGRRALRRIKTRRRVTVLCIAAVTTAVLAIGNQIKWWGGNGTEVATGTETAGAQAEAGSSEATPAASPSKSEPTMSMFAGPAIQLVTNRQPWNTIGCTLAPQGWTPQTPVTAGRVVLTPPSPRTPDAESKLVLRSSPQAETLQAVRVTESGGKVFHLGTLAGREAGQVMLGDKWLVVQLPVGDKDWNDDLLRRFLASCTAN